MSLSQFNDVTVTPIRDGSWRVASVKSQSRAFKKMSHALAFARALAFTGGHRMVVEGPDGVKVLQDRKSLTYPKLDH